MITHRIFNIRIEKSFFIIGGMLSLLLIITCALTYLLFAQYNKWLIVEKERTLIQTKVDELRQSSDDLTRFARLYATTNNQEYLKNYQRILDIRAGIAPRPIQYHHIYWDLTPEMRVSRHPPGEKESLLNTFKSLPLLAVEQDAIATSLDNSKKLTAVEMSIFAVFNNPAADEEEQKTARQILFSSQYQQFKSNIMLPIDGMLNNLEDRYNYISTRLQNKIYNIFIFFGLILAIFISLVLFMLLFVHRKVLQPVHHLTDNIRNIQQGKDMERRVFYHDEIGLLTRQFYSMKEQMDRNYNDMETISFTDALTGLYNRHYFYHMAEKQIKISQRNKQNMSVLICDVDHFKPINDTHGHLVGDEALKHVAQLINSSVRESDICARFGGEEFTVLLNNTSLQSALIIGEKIRANFESSPFVYNDITLNITISIGVSQVDNEQINEAIDQADKALYDAKNNGRNRVCSV